MYLCLRCVLKLSLNFFFPHQILKLWTSYSSRFVAYFSSLIHGVRLLSRLIHFACSSLGAPGCIVRQTYSWGYLSWSRAAKYWQTIKVSSGITLSRRLTHDPISHIFLSYIHFIIDYHIYVGTWEQVVTSWACLIIAGAVKFLRWSSFLSSWKGVAFLALGLTVVTILMHILILFSQSERSTHAKVTPAKPRNRGHKEESGSDKQH